MRGLREGGGLSAELPCRVTCPLVSGRELEVEVQELGFTVEDEDRVCEANARQHSRHTRGYTFRVTANARTVLIYISQLHAYTYTYRGLLLCAGNAWCRCRQLYVDYDGGCVVCVGIL